MYDDERVSETGSDCYPVLGGHRRGINGIKSRDEPDKRRSTEGDCLLYASLSCQPVVENQLHPYVYINQNGTETSNKDESSHHTQRINGDGVGILRVLGQQYSVSTGSISI